MRARLFLLLILLLTTTSFFWEDEQKQLRQLHQNGELAMQKRDFEAAKKVYEELFNRISIVPSSKYQVDWSTYVDVSVRLAQVYSELQDQAQAEKILSQLIAKNPPPQLVYPAQLMKARLIATLEAPVEGYYEMYQLSKVFPLEFWPNKDVTFFRALAQSLDLYYDGLMRKAKLHLTAGFYPEAISAYEELLSAIEKNCYPKVTNPQGCLTKTLKYRLAECHYLNKNYEKSLGYLHSQETDAEIIYLSALCFLAKKEYEKAMELFQNYTQLGDQSDLEHYENALFEIGHYFYQTGNFEKAKSYFQSLRNIKRKATQLATLLQGHICIEEGKSQEVERLLRPLVDILSTQDPLQYECYYLRGLAAYASGAFDQAKDFFERSLPSKMMGKWSGNSLYHLGWCYTHLGDDPLKEEAVRLGFFKKAEESFHQLLETPLNEVGVLSLAKLYTLTFRQNPDESAEKLTKLLQKHSVDFSLSGQIESLLLRAEVAASYSDKENLYALSTEERFHDTPYYAHAWYCRGVNHFIQGLHEPQSGHFYFEAAAAAFARAFLLAEKDDHNFAADILKMEAKASMCCKSPQISLTLLEKLLLQFNETDINKEESYYLQGLLASQMPSHFSVAEKTLHHVITSYPQGSYRSEALFTLGTMYYKNGYYSQAQEHFCKLAMEYPESHHASASWFWAAESAARGDQATFALRRHVYEDYPECPLAAEAYFRQFPYSSYYSGDPEAIYHLKDFEKRFQGSPLEMIVHYLIGKNTQEKTIACSHFNQALKAFSIYPNRDQTYAFFYYRTILEMSDRYLEEPIEDEALKTCEQILTSLISDFEQTNHPIASLLKQQNKYPGAWEEGEFKLVQCYLKSENVGVAQKKLNEMLLHYDRAGIREGHYLSQVWFEQGRLAMRCGDYATALNCFDIALSCAPSDQKTSHLSIWLQQSACYRAKKEYDLAMRCLSKVINAETASPLRLKAMHLRSEIYELEGRPELAIRQLEALAKKGGEWASFAKEKLRTDYGFE
jgi:tetratricopeptide (TPR) repeat protein